jgi:hypothetical protein
MLIDAAHTDFRKSGLSSIGPSVLLESDAEGSRKSLLLIGATISVDALRTPTKNDKIGLPHGAVLVTAI